MPQKRVRDRPNETKEAQNKKSNAWPIKLEAGKNIIVYFYNSFENEAAKLDQHFQGTTPIAEFQKKNTDRNCISK